MVGKAQAGSWSCMKSFGRRNIPTKWVNQLLFLSMRPVWVYMYTWREGIKKEVVIDYETRKEQTKKIGSCKSYLNLVSFCQLGHDALACHRVLQR